MRVLPVPSVLCAAIVLAVSSLGLPVPAQAQSGAPIAFDLPAGSLDATLTEIARLSRTVVSYDPQLVRGLEAPAVTGVYTVDAALRQALSGSGLEPARAADGTLTLRRVPAAQTTTLAPVTVSGMLPPTDTRGTYVVQATNSATRLNLSPRETPQSVTVVTRQRMDDQSMKNLDDVLQATTGISVVQNGSERSVYQARGQLIDNLQIDGVPANISNAYSFDAINKPTTEIYDRVEVVRGATGLLEGAGNPAASINLIRKRPGMETQGVLTVLAGSWDDYRTMLDVSSPLNEAKTLRGRAVMAYTDAGSFKEKAGKENQLFYGILEADLTPATTVTAGFSYQKDRNQGYDWSGLPTQADGAFYPMSRKTALVGDWNYLNKRNTNLFADIKHEFGNGWRFTVAGNWLSAKSDFLGNYTQRTEGDTFTLNPRLFQYDDTQWGVDAYASGPFQLLGRQHELVVGASTRKDDFDYHGGRDASYRYLVDMNNLAAFDPPAPTGLDAHMWQYNITQKQQGIYTAGRFSLTDSTTFILGARMSWFEFDRYAQTTVRTESRYEQRGKVTPYAGVVQDLNENLSAYASYTEIFKPQENIGVDGSVLPPMTGQNYEIGLKGEFMDRRVNAALALFQTDQKGRADLIQDSDLCPPGIFSCYRAAEKVRNRGVDVEINGAITPAWNVSLGYTYTQSKYAQGPLSGQTFASTYPRHLLKVSTDYRLPDRWNKLRVGGSVYAQSGIFNASTPDEDEEYKISQGAYTLVGLHAVYDVNKNLAVQFNVDNLFDRHYYQSVGNTNYWNYFGQPRTFRLAVRATF
ncbi:TonB-dependent receptor [Achromobacter sp. MFA1 R4]|uniref:TonB-dependent siderophore receptor n=1 Tax=Achromobacter sp. MFA1 R4 TaxID=1881016 RepID=UPI000953924F|nr:TonB-dependent receptor [Achromobacter sp. MFA1 R4]SIT06070.1 outer-membrane receptor for ferric coprogen and ferric-rhodotorulic acid [Achromobacter sp. MFA1 R4]